MSASRTRESTRGCRSGWPSGLAKNGRDKLTFLVDDEVESLGAWLEQLIAESTGKHGDGIVPVDSEPLGALDAYGPDRAFVRIALDGGTAGSRDELAARWRLPGHPVIRIDMSDPIDLGGEFFRWEVATAIAGAVLGIDPIRPAERERKAKEQTRLVLTGDRQRPAGAARTRGAQLVGCSATSRVKRGPAGRADPRLTVDEGLDPFIERRE